MQQESQKPRQTIQMATYRLLQQLVQQMQPVAGLAREADDPNEPNPTGVIIELLRQLVNGVEQVRAGLEALEARLDDPAVVKAIKSAMNG